MANKGDLFFGNPVRTRPSKLMYWVNEEFDEQSGGQGEIGESGLTMPVPQHRDRDGRAISGSGEVPREPATFPALVSDRNAFAPAPVHPRAFAAVQRHGRFPGVLMNQINFSGRQ